MNAWIYINIFVAAWVCNLSVITAALCQDICVYTADPEVQDVDCHNRNLDRLPAGCEGAWTLQAGRNNIVALDQTTFSGFTQLKYLYMSNGLIETISPGALDPFAGTITVISLVANKIRRLGNDTFAGMPLLEQLDLQKNRIESVQAKTFRDLPNLITLWLSHNRLTELPLSVFDGIPQLRILHLQNNSLHQINSRVFLHVQSLKEINLYSNEIASLTGNPLGSEGESLQIDELDLSQNNLTHFNCDWIAPLTVKVNLSFNFVRSISNCRLKVENLTLVNNPFDCGCESEEISEIYKTRLDLIPPTCGEPLNKQNKNLTGVSYEECNDRNMHTTTEKPKSKTSTTKLLEKLKTTTKSYQTVFRTRGLITFTKQNGLPTTSLIPIMGEQTSFSSLFTGENQIYAIPIIVTIGILFILLILFLSYCLIKKNHDKKELNHNYRTRVVQSSPLPSRQGTGQSSHVYATIPADDSGNVDQNSNNVLPSTRVHLEAENGHNCSHNCSQCCLQRWNYLSDSQDSGLADQGRNSLHEWIQAHMDNGSLLMDSSCCDCEQCYYLSIKERDSMDACSSFVQQQHTTAVIAMSILPQSKQGVGRMSPMHGVGRSPPVHVGQITRPTNEAGKPAPPHNAGRAPPNTASPHRHPQHQPSTSHGGPIPGRQRCYSCHKFRPVNHGNRTFGNQLEPVRRKTRQRDSSGYVPHNLIN